MLSSTFPAHHNNTQTSSSGGSGSSLSGGSWFSSALTGGGTDRRCRCSPRITAPFRCAAQSTSFRGAERVRHSSARRAGNGRTARDATVSHPPPHDMRRALLDL
ncbi:hypothetical protein MSZK_13600 [Mycobacterium sp. shizuoka-1]|nr:hypothetical protein MSZK_13600 [Mycobacterium sp. shizuoka-1]